MSINHRDIKRLWARSAGRCNYPGCSTLCIDCLPGDPTPFIVGHMAHIIARQPKGPRGTAAGGSDGYCNRILLCPNHHRMVDASPTSFPTATLIEWKRNHETRVAAALDSPEFSDLSTMAGHISFLLIKNKTVWQSFGPDSLQASANPLSNAVNLWMLRKLDTIVPNNRHIIKIVQRNKALLDAQSYRVACKFVVHAEAFEHNCYTRTEAVPRFPAEFERMISLHANL